MSFAVRKNNTVLEWKFAVWNLTPCDLELSPVEVYGRPVSIDRSAWAATGGGQASNSFPADSAWFSNYSSPTSVLLPVSYMDKGWQCHRQLPVAGPQAGSTQGLQLKYNWSYIRTPSNGSDITIARIFDKGELLLQIWGHQFQSMIYDAERKVAGPFDSRWSDRPVHRPVLVLFQQGPHHANTPDTASGARDQGGSGQTADLQCTTAMMSENGLLDFDIATAGNRRSLYER